MHAPELSYAFGCWCYKFQYFSWSLVILEITSKAVSHITTEELYCLFSQLHLASSKSQISVFHSRTWIPAMPAELRENFCKAWFCLLKEVSFLEKRELNIFQIVLYLSDPSLLRGENTDLLAQSHRWHHRMRKKFFQCIFFVLCWRWWGQSAAADAAKLLATTPVCPGALESRRREPGCAAAPRGSTALGLRAALLLLECCPQLCSLWSVLTW